MEAPIFISTQQFWEDWLMCEHIKGRSQSQGTQGMSNQNQTHVARKEYSKVAWNQQEGKVVMHLKVEIHKEITK
jgi:hypothetical protein